MIKQIVSLALSAAVLVFGCAEASARTKDSDRRAAFAEKVRAGVEQLGTGDAARVKVKLSNGQRVAGYVDRVSEDGFVVRDLETGRTTVVPYGSVNKVQGNNINSGVKIALTFLITMAIAMGILAIILSTVDT